MTARVGKEAYGCVRVSVVLVIVPSPCSRNDKNVNGLPSSPKVCSATLTVPVDAAGG